MIDKLHEQLKPIQQVSQDLARFAKQAMKTHEIPEQRSLLVSIFAQLEILKMRLNFLRNDKDYKDLWG